jgi:hypothetical protein
MPHYYVTVFDTSTGDTRSAYVLADTLEDARAAVALSGEVHYWETIGEASEA